MIPHIGDLVVKKRGWVSQESFKNGVAIAQVIPGATAMQVAAYSGLRSRGLGGALAAYMGFLLPAFVLITALSSAYTATHGLPVSKALFRGLQVVVIAIIARAAITFGQTAIKGWRDAIIPAASAGYLLWGGSPFTIVILAAIAGSLVYARFCPTHRQAEDRGGKEGAFLPRHLIAMLLGAAVTLLGLYLTDRRLFELSLLMLKVDLLAFGGGFASVPLMLHEVVSVRGWMSANTFMDGIAMGQVTPGPIVITASFVGYLVARIGGAIVATASVFFPSFVILVAVVPRFDRLNRHPLFQRAMRGVLTSFVGLLIATAIKFGLAANWSPASIVLGCAAFAALVVKVDILWVVLASGTVSALLLR